MIRGKNKAQITIFIILGLVVFLMIIAFYIFQREIKNEPLKEQLDKKVISYVEYCLEYSLKESIKFFGNQEINYINSQDFKNLSFLNIPYFYYLGENKLATIKECEEILNKIIETYFNECINDYEILKRKGYKVNYNNNQEFFVNINENNIEILVFYDLFVSKGDKTIKIDNFNSKIYFDFLGIHEILSSFINEQNKNPDFIPIGYIGILSHKENIKIEIIDFIDNNIIYSFKFNNHILDKEPYLVLFTIKYNWSDI